MTFVITKTISYDLFSWTLLVDKLDNLKCIWRKF